jgi:hypothetical protein
MDLDFELVPACLDFGGYCLTNAGLALLSDRAELAFPNNADGCLDRAMEVVSNYSVLEYSFRNNE